MARTGALTSVAIFSSNPEPFAKSAVFGSSKPTSVRQSVPRTRLWDLHPSLHCSIVGTCLTTAELRQILRKAGISEIEKRSNHDLHAEAVTRCGTRETASKLLHKALDRKHGRAIDQFAHTKTKQELMALWLDFMEKGEIPGAYWAVLTHPQVDIDLMRFTFGEVHMLSHLVGAANRADIRRLRELEEQNAALQDKVDRQQRRLRDAAVENETTIRNLRVALTEALTTRATNCSDAEVTESVVLADLHRQFKREAMRSARFEARLQAVNSELALKNKSCIEWERRYLECQGELEAIEASLSHTDLPQGAKTKAIDLKGKALLYVGGRAHQVPQLKRLAEEHGAAFMHHDGGLEDNSRSLTALAGRADAVLFPVDCISHGAVATVKRVCRQLGKTYFPLRSSGLTSFTGAISRMELPSGNSNVNGGDSQ